MLIKRYNIWSFILRNAEGGEGDGGVSAGAGEGAGAVVEGGDKPAGEVAPPATLLSDPGVKPAVEEGKEGETKVEVVPFDTAQLTLPDGMTLPEEIGKSFGELINDAALTPQERGQKLLDLYSEQLAAQGKAAVEASTKAFTDLNTEWREASMKLPEFASNPEAEIGSVKQGLIAAGAKPEFFQALDLTGAGNNPHVLQMLHKLSRPYVEGGSVSGAQPKSRQSMASIMYPTMQAKE